MKSCIAYIILLSLLGSCSLKFNPSINENDLKVHLSFLASDSLKGRDPGTPEDSVTTSYIAGEFKKYGLKPFFNESYIQHFEIISNISATESNALVFNSKSYTQHEDFLPRNFSANSSVKADIVFAGYGFEFQNDTITWSDYGNKNTEGKWVMILLGEPKNNEVFMSRSREMDKAMLAVDKGAAGVLFVAGKEYDPQDKIDHSGGREPAINIPVIQIKRNMADEILKGSATSIEELEKKIISYGPVKPLVVGKELEARVEMERNYSKTSNVAAWLEGSNPTLKNEWIVIGAHHDHLGMGGEGSSSRRPDTIAIHYGADDNASGVATMLENAAWFAGSNIHPARSILFLAFGAEEKGLLGSRYFIENSNMNMREISLMINVDMVGRMKPDSILQIGGVGTALGMRPFLQEINQKYHFRLEFSDAGYGPSDHASFYSKDVPVIFLSTGPHKDYHTPFDRFDSLNIPGILMVSEFVADVAKNVAQMDSILTFQESGPKENTSRSYRNRITLGIMPDVSGDPKEGMEVLAVTKGKPADMGGMKKGDLVTEIEGKEIKNVYDYMYRLNSFRPGETIVVKVKRNNDFIDLLIQL